jgi:hypothetical protein
MLATITLVTDQGGYWVAMVDDGDTQIWADNRIGPWTVPVDANGAYDPTVPPSRRDVRRRELVPEVSAKLRHLVRAGGGDATVSYTPDTKAPTIPIKTTTPVQSIAQQMAAAGAAAIRKAA